MMEDYKSRAEALRSQLGEESPIEKFYRIQRNKREDGKRILSYEFVGELFEKDGLVIIPITDVHLGNRQANIVHFQEFLDLIMEIPNCVTILNGDLAEIATKTSVGMAMFEEDKNIPEQLETLYEMLSPLAEAGKILGMGPGNHEQRVAHMIGMNPMQILADRLGVPYFGYQGYFRLKVGEIIYKVAFHHGVGGGSTTGAKANSAEKLNKVVPLADLYVRGHTHGKQWHRDEVWLIEDDEDKLVRHQRTYVVGGSFLSYFGGYSEEKVLPPSSTGAVYVQLSSQEKEIRVII
ncbi:hypothetical protein_gp114 [Bacillus phage vB_BceM_WH1]|nr:hypothetical protein_gp114 [Bacillus phage vB_BceM_WH1]